MIKMKNLTNSLAIIPLVSLSVVGLNFAPTAVATTVIPKNTKATEALLAQQVSCSVLRLPRLHSFNAQKR
jgi:hypothetical protein